MDYSISCRTKSRAHYKSGRNGTNFDVYLSCSRISLKLVHLSF